jgi:DNA-binding response OmpR family regulator
MSEKFTAKEYANGTALAKEHGASDFLPKPFEPENLQHLIEKHLKGENKK